VQNVQLVSWSFLVSLFLQFVCIGGIFEKLGVGFLSGLDLTICTIFKDAIFIYKSIKRAQAKLHSKLLNPPGKPNNL